MKSSQALYEQAVLKLKILHVGKYFSPFSGGLENYMRDAMVALGRRGIESAALVHRHSLSLKTIDETFSADGHNFHVVRTGMWARLLFTPISPGFPWHFRRLIRGSVRDPKCSWMVTALVSHMFFLYMADSRSLLYQLFGELSSCFKCDSPVVCR